MAASALITAVSVLYPCTHCRSDFAEAVRASPVAIESRDALAQWVCHRHNEVNAKTGKGQFSCDAESLSRRWRTGCQEGAADSLGQQS